MTALPDPERLAWLRLARAEGVGPVVFSRLIERYGSAAKALEALPKLAARGGRPAPLTLPSDEAIRSELEAGAALGARLLCAGEAGFPAMLAALDPPPPVIWALGRLELLDRPSVAIVGARNASAGGQSFARGLARDLGEAGLAVVSGLARGIDGAAHEGALKTGTVAVLAGGVDDIYPPEHAGLYRRIARDGCVVSESPVGRRATAKDFPRRNRLISGLAQGVVIVEAELKSGSLITARLAGEQGREVFAVPGSPLDPRAKGTNDLIRQGATLCEGAEDVLRGLERPAIARTPARPPPERPIDGEEADDEALRRRIEGLLSPTPTARDELVRAAGASAAAVNGVLMELALAGRAELLAGGLVARKPA